ncbi:acetyltransferase [Granulosicoccus antarcticus]|uniref:Acetyltransferase EpsM n=1 Tax=Granulosicoccus antarcticus IMCC3135 TaxID=1192854 RepID=A0A2Z2P123_9GAMM|nr:acetyltransferase [Granulosicoccus antarcticus]ASJ74920.1 Putative acetyltransferase EpsM [Granulosicoccus antarcticus IMCC3135]
MNPTLAVIGAGGHARVIADTARETGEWEHIEFYDDTWPQESFSGDWPLVGQLQDLLNTQPRDSLQLIVASGDNQRRHALQSRLEGLGWIMATLIHPDACISSGATLEPGCIVMAGVVINFGVTIGAASIINTRASVDHDCYLGNAVHISPGATLCGKVCIGDRTWVGAGAVVVQNIRMGSDSIIGAGATVLEDIPDDVVAVGCPARQIKSAPCVSRKPANSLRQDSK